MPQISDVGKDQIETIIGYIENGSSKKLIKMALENLYTIANGDGFRECSEIWRKATGKIGA